MRVDPSTRTVSPFVFLARDADPAPGSAAIVYQDAWIDGGCNSADSISVSDIDGSNPRPVTPRRINESGDRDPVFSPDAAKVAFERGRYISTANATGTGLRRLAVGRAPSWQPR